MRAISLFFVGLTAANALSILPEQQALRNVVARPPVDTKESWQYVDCGLSTDPIQIRSIQVSPDPPKPGENMTVTVTALVTETIEEGAYADVVVKFGLVKFMNKRFDLCEEARNADTSVQCPVEEGEYTVSQTVALPKEIPKAKISVDIDGYTTEDADLMCVRLRVDFTKRRWPGLW